MSLPVPKIMEQLPDMPDIIQQLSAILPDLTNHQKSILIEKAKDFLSNNIRTDTQIARDLGIHPDTIYLAKANPVFGRAMSILMRSVVQATADEPIRNLQKLAQKSTKANEILLRIAEVYQPSITTKNLNVNVDATGAYSNTTDLVERMIVTLKSQGWTWERLYDVWNSIPA